jgi:hypothetical protein
VGEAIMNNFTTYHHKYNDERECWMTCFYQGNNVMLDEAGNPQVQYWGDLADFKEMIDRVTLIDKEDFNG